jgi:flagellar basal body-associated protein FliL
MKTLISKAAKKVTRRNAVWFLKTNVQSWVLQGVLVGLLTVAGVGAVAAMVSAKAAAYTVFLAQCVNAAKAK